MNKEGMYEYGLIQEGGYYGDISLLLNMPSEFSYFYNPTCEKPLLLLSLDVKSYMNLCHKHPLSKELLTERARKRREMFENYKSIILLKYMRTIFKNPAVVTSKEQQMEKLSMTPEMKAKITKGNEHKI